MTILVQGIGCTETGARVVLHELLKVPPLGARLVVLTTSDSAREFVGGSVGRMGPAVRVIGLSHRWFGRWLRLPLEILVALAAALRLVDRVVNLSHYGLCFGGRYTLYVHSPLLMDETHQAGWGDGRPNRLKRWMLDSCIRRADLIVLQTRGMAAQLRRYCERGGLPPPPCRTVRPRVSVTTPPVARKHFGFQLFYPTSRFPHKRAGLAVAGARRAHRERPEVGLVITVEGEPAGDGVVSLGLIPREEVFAWFASADAMLFTSERETLGLPLLEALEFGVPVIAPRLGYAEELLGEAGCYFDEGTAEAVATAILRCREELPAWQARVRERAREIRRDAASWAEHWDIFLLNSAGGVLVRRT